MKDQLVKIQEKDILVNSDFYEKEKDETKHGLTWNRLFGAGDPYDEIKWEIRDARITKGNGQVVFEQKNVEVPNFWSQTATDIVASKYFRGKLDSPEREQSARQMIDRVANTISGWGFKDDYFVSKEDCENFRQDLKWLLINQYSAFNSPVWFNVGVREHPQCSACFILSVEDDMKSIFDWYRDEGWIFKFGSGAGLNLSNLRSSKEPLSRGGFSSGPVSFMKGADGIANSIRSGGETRRAAKMVVLNVDHPDIKPFIFSKQVIENMTKILVSSGIHTSIEGDLFDPYTLLPYQNANNSVRVTDDFMRKVEADDYWELKAVTSGETLEKPKAREVMRWIAQAAWASADPGMQYDTTINNWHTCLNSGRINASNPCSEYMHLDNSACNLSSLNLMKFLREDGFFDVELYKQAIDTMIVAQDIIVDNSSYPTPKITENAKAFRELGLGYANLGALLMTAGLPYDSDRGRSLAGLVSSVLGGEAYLMSARLVHARGPFSGFALNREPMLKVITQHLQAAEDLVENIRSSGLYDDDDLKNAAVDVWREAFAIGRNFGFRNSQATVLAPTGTISFLMDCATTGIEPGLAIVAYKKLVGGGSIKLVNDQVQNALERLGYTADAIKRIDEHILEKETIEGAADLKPEHLPIFDCSFKATNGTRSISYMGHLKMMSVVQPFISGAISKTVNLPADATVDDMFNAFIDAWRLGLKAVAFYRDGSKTVQPLNVSNTDNQPRLARSPGEAGKLVEKVNGYTRIKLPDERPSITHKFSVANFEGYLTVGLYPDTKKPGETFITIAKEGSTISGLFDTIATLISMCLQSGMPLKSLVKKFKDLRFEPSGMTSSEEIPFAKSVVDYIFRYLGYKFLTKKDREEIFGPDHAGDDQPDLKSPGVIAGSLEPVSNNNGKIGEPVPGVQNPPVYMASTPAIDRSDAMICAECGTIMFKAGSCFSCPNCFTTTGVCN